MTQDDYQQMRSMYADMDELCRGVEEAGSAAASEKSVRRLVRLFHDQQREPEQIRSFVQYLGVSDEVLGRGLGEAAPAEEAAKGSGIA